MKYLSRKTIWRSGLAKGMAALFVLLVLAGGAGLSQWGISAPAVALAEEPDKEVPEGEEIVERDGSKIEGIDIFWITPDSLSDNKGNATSRAELDDDSHLFLATKSNAELLMTFQFEISLSGQFDYAPGDIQITIPAQVWHNRIYEGEKKLAGYVDPNSLQGMMDLSIPAAPSTKADFNWQLVDGNYVITNTHTIGATSKAMFQASIINLWPVNVVDMSECDPITVHCEVVTNQGNTISRTSLPISARVDTISEITAAHKASYKDLYENYYDGLVPQNLLSNLPQGTSPEDYVFVRWYSYVYHWGNQPFSLDIEDHLAYAVDEQGNYVTDGIFLGLVDHRGETVSNQDGSAEHTANIMLNEYHTPTAYPYDHMLWMWSAYRRDDFDVPLAGEPLKTYYFRNSIDWILTEADGRAEGMNFGTQDDERKVTRASANAEVIYTPVRWVRPSGSFGINKWTESAPYEDWNYGYGLNLLQMGRNVDMNFHLRTIGFGYDHTREDGADPYDPDAYGRRGWKQVTEDYRTFFDASTEELTSSDFQMKSMRIQEPTLYRYGKGADSSWAYFGDTSLPVPDLQIEYQLNGDGVWRHAATAQWGSDGHGVFRFTDVRTADGVKTAGMSVFFPENTTDVRHTFVSNVFGGQRAEKSDIAAITWDVYPTITLKASEKNREIADKWFEITPTPKTKFKNDMRMDVYIEENGGWQHIGADYDFSRATIGGASYGVTMEKSVDFNRNSIANGGDNDTENRRITLHYTAKVYEQSNLTTRREYDSAVEEGVIPAETSGTWYDLLPVGVTPVLSTVRLRKDDIITNMYTIPDYKGTGRIMLVVEADLTPVPDRLNGDEELGFRDTLMLSFDAHYTWEDIDQMGNNLVNYISFESNSPNLHDNTLGNIEHEIGEPDNPSAGNNATTPDMPQDILDAMTDLDPNTDDCRFVYGKAEVNIDIDTAALSGIHKSVRNDLVGVWTQGLSGQEQVTVFEGHNYTYRLRVSSSRNTLTSDIVIYDTIENYHIPDPKDDTTLDATKKEDYEDKETKIDWQGDWQGKGQWRGTLLSIDLSEFVDAGVAPVLYYSMLDDLTFADSTYGMSQEDRLELFSKEAYDLTDTRYWHGAVTAQQLTDGVWTVPESLSGRITAIAIDARKMADGSDYVLEEEGEIAAFMHMVAPDDDSDPDAWHAKGAYAHKTDAQGNPLQEIDWEKATDPANNMYAFNNTRLKCVQRGTGDSDGSSDMMIRNDYTRVGIVPGIVGVRKTWEDQNDHDAIRPSEVTVTLMRKLMGEPGDYEPVRNQNGEIITVVLSDSNDWEEYIFQIDQVDMQGRRYIYSFAEEGAEGYDLGITSMDMIHFVLENRHKIDQVPLRGQKQWNDQDDALLLRPMSITVRLLRDGEVVSEIEVTPDADGNWTYDFGNWDKCKAGGEEYVYTIEEDYVPKYVSSSEGYALLINDYAPYGNLEVIKHLEQATEVAAAKPFTFTFTFFAEQTEQDKLDNKTPDPLTGKYRYAILAPVQGGEGWAQTPVAEGEIASGGSVSMLGGQKIVVYDLPSDSTYIVEEADEAGFTQTGVAGSEGIIHAGHTEKAEFTNRYDAAGSVQLDARKVITGHTLRKGEFRFQIKDVTPGSETYGKVLRTAVNGASNMSVGGQGMEITSRAEVKFGQLSYTQDDAGKTFLYEISEVQEGKGGHIYDKTVYTVEITVTDNGDGTLNVSAERADGSSDVITFENAYEAQGTLQLRAWKSMPKRAMEDGEFTFELYAYDSATGDRTGSPIAETTNDADGNIVFPIVFDQDDLSNDPDTPAVYQYVVVEKKHDDDTVIFTDQEYLVTVEVYDNNDGTLSFRQTNRAAVRVEEECAHCLGLIKLCTYCGGTGKISSFEVSDGDSMPVFVNDLEDGALSVSKRIQGENDPMKEFTFYVRLTGPDVPDKLEYVLTQITSVTETSEAKKLRNMKASPRASQIYTITQEELRKDPFAVLGTDGTLTFVRLEPQNGAYTYDGLTFDNNKFNSDHVYEVGDGRFVYQLKFLEEGSYSLPWYQVCAWRYQTDLIKNVVMRDGLRPKSCASMFGDLTNVVSITLDKMDTSEVRNFSSMFRDNTNMVSLELAGFNTQNATSMFRMFQNCWSLAQLSFGSGFTAGNVTEISQMFMGCSKLESLDISMFGVCKASELTNMFNGCSSLKTLNASGFGTTGENATMSSMFMNCFAMETLDLTGFETATTVNMHQMFSNCNALKELDLSSFDTGSVTTMTSMFFSCDELMGVNLSSFNTAKVTSFYQMFRSCQKLEELDVSGFDTSAATDFGSMFRDTNALKKLDISNFTINENANIGEMFICYTDGYDRELILCDSIVNGTGSKLIAGNRSKNLSQYQKITMPENCSWNLDDYGYAYNPPNTNGYTGNWIHKQSGKTVSSTVELFNGTQPGGVWEWEYRGYTIRFASGEDAGGSMQDISALNDEAAIFTPAFYKFGYRLTRFTDGMGNEFTVAADGTVTIPAGTYSESGVVITLTAQWEKIDTSVTLENGVFCFTLHGNETATFNNLPASTGYEVWEETPAGWVLVSKSGDSGVIEPLETSEAVFTNAYAPAQVNVYLRASKRMDGKPARDGVFSFRIDGHNMSQVVSNMAGGVVEYGPLTFTAPGEHTYTIRELQNAGSGIEYDGSEYQAVVSIERVSDGSLGASVTYHDSTGAMLGAPPVFENRTMPGQLKVSKVIDGGLTEKAKEKLFTFEAVFADDRHQLWTGNENGQIVDSTGKAYDVENGKVTFQLIGGQSVTFVDLPVGLGYEIQETGSMPGWTFDGHVASGTTEAGKTKTEIFTNNYSAKGEVVLMADKALVGRNPVSGEFSFELLVKDGESLQTVPCVEERVQINPGEEGEAKYETRWVARFEAIAYDREGKHEYIIREVEDEDESIVYSDKEIAVTVTVTDIEGEGRLTAQAAYTVGGETCSTITNSVKPGSLKLSKTVVSPIEAHKDEVFLFSLSLKDANGEHMTGTYPLAGGGELEVRSGMAEVSLKGGQSVTITGLPHGTTYSIEEAAKPGFEISSEGESGTIEYEQTAEAAFTNTYSAKGQYVLKANKTLNGDALTEGRFIFELLDGEGNTLQTVTNAADGSVTFSPLYFTEADAGEKTYAIREKATGEAGMIYDATEYSVVLTVVDNGYGVMVVNGGVEFGGVDFINTYEDKIDISATKRWMDDAGHEDARRDIIVSLYQQAGEGSRELHSTKTIKADATGDALTVTWTDLPIKTEGGIGIDYTIEEQMQLIDGESNPYESVIMGSAQEGFTIINRYNAVSVQPMAHKTLVGDTLADNQFTFVLMDSNRNVLETVKNKADGSVTFSPLTYTPEQTGTYNYTIMETERTNDAITYDNRVWALSVDVTRSDTGRLKAEMTYAHLPPDSTVPVFTNYMKPGSLTLSKTVVSTVNEHKTDKEFTFTVRLTDENDTPLSGIYPLKDGGSVTFGANGEAALTLKHHESVTIMDLPYKTKYTVTEAQEDGFEQSASGAAGSIGANTGSTAAFTNTYSARGQYTFRANKTLNGDTLEAGRFTFDLYEGGEVNADKLIESVTNAADGSVTFTTLRFTHSDVGRKTYTIVERCTNEIGVTYDTTQHKLVLDISDNGDGTLSIGSSMPANGVPFVNSFKGTIDISATKQWLGDESESRRDVIVTLYATVDGESRTLHSSKTIEAGATGEALTVTWTDLPIIAKRTGGDKRIHYSVEESLQLEDGENNPYETEIKGSEEDGFTIVNTYNAVKVQFEAHKTLEGDTLAAGDFTFELYAGDKVQEDKLIESVTNAADGSVTFTELTYAPTQIGTHVYTIAEKQDGDNTITYDGNTYTMTVNVSRGDNGKLQASVTYSNLPEGSTVPQFVNRMKPGSLRLNKTVVSTVNAHRTDKEFTFTVKLTDEDDNVLTGTYPLAGGGSVTFDADGETALTLKHNECVTIMDLPYKTKYTVTEAQEDGFTQSASGAAGSIGANAESAAAFTNTYSASGEHALTANKILKGGTLAAGDFTFELYEGEGVQAEKLMDSKTNAADGAVTFKTLSFTHDDVGRKTYTIREVDAGKEDIVYDEKVYTVYLDITDNGDGTLSFAEEIKTGESAVTFTNFNLHKTDVSATKEWVGDEEHTNLRRDLTFTLWQMDAAGTRAEYGSKTILRDAEGDELTVTWEDVPLDYVNGGEIAAYTYEVEEDIGYAEGENNPYDTSISGSAQDGFTVSNIYNVVSVQPEAHKTLEGDTLAAGQFTFELYAGDKVQEDKLIESKTNDADGSVTFTELTYAPTQIGTHVYTIAEKQDGDNTITYDGNTYTMTVNVSRGDNGNLQASVTYSNLPDGSTVPQFVNRMKPGSLRLNKTVVSTVNAHKTKEFTFTVKLTDEDDNVLTGTYLLAGGGSVTLNASGEATLTLKHNECVTITNLPYKTKYTVTEAQEDGFTQSASGAAGSIGANAESAAAFTNTYSASGERALTANKILKGGTLAAGDFTFELYEGEEVKADKLMDSKSNAADGAVTFKTLSFTHNDVGRKTYTIREVDAGEEDIVYDEKVYTVYLDITDNGDGTLSFAKEIKTGESAVTFTNFNLHKTDVSATKEWVGDEEHTNLRRDLTFTLWQMDAAGERKQYGESKNIPADAVGAALTVTWEDVPLDYVSSGEIVFYTYTVEENIAYAEGEKHEYDATVSGSVSGGFTVTNRYDSTQVSLDAYKTLESEELEDGDFLFELRDEEGTLIEQVRNTAEGDVVFGDLTFTLGDLADIEKAEDGTRERTLVYTITEVNEGRAGYIYDDTVFAAQITLMQAADGSLSAEVEYLRTAENTSPETVSSVEFVNERRTIDFIVTKSWEGGDGPIELTLYANGEKMNPQPPYTRDGDVYTFAGLYEYDDDGKLIVYSAKEKYVDGFVTIYKNVEPYAEKTKAVYNGGTIINRFVPPPSLVVTKIWSLPDGVYKTPDIVLTLYCNGVKTDVPTPKPDRHGRYKYYNLPSTVDGKIAKYTVVEEPVSGFSTTYRTANGADADFARNGDYIINTMIPVTGDTSGLALWSAMAAISGALLVLMRRKRRTN